MKRALSFPADRVTLPKGTRVVLVVPRVDETGVKQRAGVLATVREIDGDRYTVETPAGSVLHVERDAIQLQREDLLESIARRQHDHARLAEHIVLEVTVGSRAWGLADESSDEDLRGCFVLPFDDAVGVFDAPDEIAAGEGQYWEIEKFVRHALRADPNTLETLWSPLVKRATPIGQRLIDEREIFSSLHVLGSFGRYAQSQLKKLERTQLRHEQLARMVDAVAAGVGDDASLKRALDDPDEIHALVRSLFDRGLIRASSLDALRAGVAELGANALKPEPVRPKNAYNLVRLLASARHWLTEGTPLIRVEGALREELLRIKRSEVPLEQVLARAEELARDVEECARTCTKLPRDPDVERAHALLVAARRASVSPARTSLAVIWSAGTAWSDVDLASVRRFVEPLVRAHDDGKIIALALSGAHAYGFPSPDSDLDLKAIHVVPATRVLGLKGAPAPLEHVAMFEGKEMDVSSHELGQACELLLKGNGNMLERVLARIALVDTPLLAQLVDATKRNLSRRLSHHYRGFFQQMLREMDKERAGFAGGAKAKRILYAYRVALTGVHALLAGAVEPDVRVLAPLYGFAEDVRVLIERKATAELAVLTETEAAPFVARLPALDALLADALGRSVLPEGPREPGAFEDVLVAARRAADR